MLLLCIDGPPSPALLGRLTARLEDFGGNNQTTPALLANNWHD
jgi:hypothetical protein